MACYLSLNYFAGARSNVRSALVRLAARGWRDVDSTAGSLEGQQSPRILLSKKKKHVLAIAHQ